MARPLPIIPGLKPETLLEMIQSGRSVATIRAHRRYIVSHLALHSGLEHEDIAKHVNEIYGYDCNAQTVADDLVHLRKQCTAVAELATEKLVKRELNTLAELEAKAQELYTRGQVKDYSETILKIQKRRSMLLGLDKPIKVAVHRPRTQDMTDEELEAAQKRGEKALEEMTGGNLDRVN